MEKRVQTKGPMSHSAKLITSCVIYYCTFTMGLGISFIGASLVELTKLYNTDIPTISKVFTIVTFSFLFGAIACGVLFNYVNRQLTCVVLLLLMGLASISLPHMPSIALFFATAALSGFAGAGYDTAQIVWIIEMWESNAAVYIQLQHFSFALGTMFSPFVVKPFLSEEAIATVPESINIQSNYSTDQMSQSDGGSSTLSSLIYQFPAEGNVSGSNLHWPFLIGGLASMLGAFFLLSLYFVKKYEKPSSVAAANAKNEKDEDFHENGSSGLSKSCNSKKVILIALSAVTLGAYCGMEMCSIQFLPTFARFIGLKLNVQEAALILSGLTGAFTIGRGIGIVIVLQVLPEILLLCNVVLILIGNTLMYFFADTSYPILWASAITLGMGFSTVFPSFYGFIEKHLKVSNVVGGLMIVAGGLVSSLYPIIIGSYVEQNPYVLMYTNYFSLVACVSAFTAIYCITRKKSNIRRDDLYTVNEDIAKNTRYGAVAGVPDDNQPLKSYKA